jgi:hypothetical protein
MRSFLKSVSIHFPRIKPRRPKNAAPRPAVDNKNPRTAPQETQGAARAPDGRPASARPPLPSIPSHVLKPVPYASKKRQHNRGVCLNGQVELKDETPDTSGETKVWCRHFAIKFAQYANKKSALVAQFSSELGIRNLFRHQLKETDQDFKDAILSAHPHSQQFVHEAYFGKYLVAIANALETAHANGESTTSANILFNSSVHSFAIHVERKAKHKQAYFAVKVFDPSTHTEYKRMTVADPKEFSKFPLKEWLISPEIILKDYEVRGQALTAHAVCLEKNIHPDLAPMECVPPDFVPSETDISVAVFDDFHAVLPEMLKRIFQGEMPEENAITLLHAKTPNGHPSLYLASQLNYSRSAEILGLAIANSSLSNTAKVQLFESQSPRGHSALYVAMYFGHANVVRALGIAVSAANLTSAQKRAWLQTAAPDGVTGIYRALVSGNGNAAAAFGDIAKMLLPDENVFEVVAARQSSGPPGVIDALFYKHLDAAKAGLKLLADTASDPQQILDLLSPYDIPELPISDAAKAVLRSALDEQRARLVAT